MLPAQDPFYINFDTQDGLPSSEVYDLAIDSLGMIWATTDRGICTYDGYQFKTYTTADGLSNNTNFEMLEDPTGRLWFTAADGSLSYFQAGKFHVYLHNSALKTVNQGRWITGLIFKKDSLYFCNLRNSVGTYFSLHLPTGQIRKNNIITADNIYTTDQDYRVYYVDLQGDTLFYHERFKFDTQEFIRTSEGHLLAVFYDNFVEISRNNYQPFTALQGVSVDYVTTDPRNNIWLGTNQGAWLFPHGDLQQTPRRFFENLSITAIKMDRDGNYWFSSLEKGIFLLPAYQIQRILTNEQIAQREKILSIGLLENIALAGTSNGKILVIDQKNLTTTATLALAPRQISRINTYQQRAYANGFVLVENAGQAKIEHEYHSSMTIFQLNDSTTLHPMTTGYKIFYHDINAFESITCDLPINNQRVTDIYQPTEQEVWLGTMEGLFEFRLDDLYHIRSLNRDSLLHTRITTLKPLNPQQLWLATIGNGLLFHTPERVVQFGQKAGLSSNLLNKIELQGDSIIWIGTNRGLNQLKYQLVNGFPVIDTIIRYTTSDGLLSNYINDLKFADGHLWLATNEGINYFRPTDLERTFAIPKVTLDLVSLIKDNQPILSHTRLAAHQNDLLFKFTGISFSKPVDAAFYRYQLNDTTAPNDWFYTNERSARFTNLTAGNYEFKVQARNKHNQWSRAQIFRFTIRPHYAQTWWFRLLVGASLLSLLWYFWNNRTQGLKREKQLQAALFRTKDAELSALRNQMNPHFVFNSLNAIQNYIFKNDIENANYYLTRFSRLMRSSLEHSKLEYIPLADELNFIKNYLALEQLRFPQLFDFQLFISKDIDSQSIFIPPLLLQPILENSVKYAFKNIDYRGEIRIEIKLIQQRQAIKIVIMDNGIGLPASPQPTPSNHTPHHSIGLTIIKNRIDLLNSNQARVQASFWYANRKDRTGVKTVFVLPIKFSNQSAFQS